MITFDPLQYRLGSVCKYGHTYLDTGKSLRYLRRRSCVVCARESGSLQKYNQKEERRKKRFLSLPVCPYPKPEFDSKKFYLSIICSRKHEFCPGMSLYSVSSRSCPECTSLTGKIRREANLESERERGRKHYHLNKERYSEYSKNRYHLYKAEITEKRKPYQIANLEKKKRRDYDYIRTPRGKFLKLQAVHKRRALKSSAHHVPWTKEQAIDRAIAFDNACAYCGSKEKLTIDHFLPIKNGGCDCLGNLIPACKFCNSSKQAKDPKNWYESQEFYSKAKWNKILNVLGLTKTTHTQMPLF